MPPSKTAGQYRRGIWEPPEFKEYQELIKQRDEIRALILQRQELGAKLKSISQKLGELTRAFYGVEK